MEIIVNGRNAEIADRFRKHVSEKLAKIEQLAPRARRVDVVVTHERNPRLADRSERIEITVHDKGPVIRAEAAASDRWGALDLASAKLFERLRRARDRRKDHRPTHVPTPPRPEDLIADPKVDPVEEAPEAPEESRPQNVGDSTETQLGDSPVIVRQKLHPATPLTVDQALYEMELVGHPFYLFIDKDSGQPCAVYHRHGWTYGVIRLDTTYQVESDDGE